MSQLKRASLVTHSLVLSPFNKYSWLIMSLEAMKCSSIKCRWYEMQLIETKRYSATSTHCKTFCTKKTQRSFFFNCNISQQDYIHHPAHRISSMEAIRSIKL